MIQRRPLLFSLQSIFVFLLFIQGAIAQIVVDEAPRGLYYERTARVRKFKDMKDFRDVFHYDKLLLGRNRISGNIAYNTGRVLIDDGKEIHTEYRQAISFFTRIRFLEEFSFNSTFYKDFNRKATARWISDYSYSIGRYNWRPNKVNFGYENYINNKYTDDLKTMGEKFLEGYYFVSYSRMLSEKLSKKIRLDSTSSTRFMAALRYSIRYRNEREEIHGGLFTGKPVFVFGIRHTLFWNIYLEGAVYLYASPKYQQQPWDPDYTYGFGYFDWRSFRFSITYGNWAINRFPWNKTYYPRYGFIDGNFRFIANYIW